MFYVCRGIASTCWSDIIPVLSVFVSVCVWVCVENCIWEQTIANVLHALVAEEIYSLSLVVDYVWLYRIQNGRRRLVLSGRGTQRDLNMNNTITVALVFCHKSASVNDTLRCHTSLVPHYFVYCVCVIVTVRVHVG